MSDPEVSAASWYAGQVRLIVRETVAKPVARVIHLLLEDDGASAIDLSNDRQAPGTEAAADLTQRSRD